MTELSAVLAAADDASSSTGGGSNFTMIALLALAFGAFWFMSRRSRKQQAKTSEFRNNLVPGDDVMTGSGMYGTIVEVDDESITLESSPGGPRTRWVRQAILKKIEPPVELEDEVVDGDDEDPAVSEAERIARANDA